MNFWIFEFQKYTHICLVPSHAYRVYRSYSKLRIDSADRVTRKSKVLYFHRLFLHGETLLSSLSSLILICFVVKICFSRLEEEIFILWFADAPHPVSGFEPSNFIKPYTKASLWASDLLQIIVGEHTKKQALYRNDCLLTNTNYLSLMICTNDNFNILHKALYLQLSPTW